MGLDSLDWSDAILSMNEFISFALPYVASFLGIALGAFILSRLYSSFCRSRSSVSAAPWLDDYPDGGD